MRSGQDFNRSPKLSPWAAIEFDIFFVSTPITSPDLKTLPLPRSKNLAGAEGFEPPSSVLETDSLTVELTPLNSVVSAQWSVFLATDHCYFTSLCDWCLRHRGQNFLNSRRSVVVFRFLVVE